jgi:DNA invertase Pin-like site-specific DNA recombinase
MKTANTKTLRCAIYTRVSTDAGLEQDFNSLDAQREASEAYIKSQAHEGWQLIRTAYDDGGFSGGSLERPALQKLLEDVRAKRVDIIVVYKVDRLTRSLADFAKLVELFDACGTSFVSVTQSFNTTTSMGRLTLNMLLSFAQFEREVTSERIRDKIAASKKRGIWVGGVVPLGYQVIDRKLVIEPKEAATVRMIFERYAAIGSASTLITELKEKGVVTRRRQLSTGRVVGGVPLTGAPLGYLLRNRTYVGEINHRDKSYPGEHQPIIDNALFDAVQAKLSENLTGHRAKWTASDALLIGRLYDDAGNRMTPTYSSKKGVRHRYYVSRALQGGRKSDCGTHPRVAADQIESLVANAVRLSLVGKSDAVPCSDDARELLQPVRRVVIAKDALHIELEGVDDEQTVVQIPWKPRPGKPKREVLEPVPGGVGDERPIRAEVRVTLVRAIALGRTWLQELVAGTVKDTDEIATREGRSQRSVHMTMSLAFLAPDIVEAAVSGQLPRRIGITRLTDLPPSWRQQRETLGLRQPA